MRIESSDCHMVIHGNTDIEESHHPEAHRVIDNVRSFSHLAIRRVLSYREDQSGRALGCSYSVPNFVEVLSLLYDPNQPRVLEGTQHLEGEMARVAFNLDTCMQPARSHRPRTRTSCPMRQCRTIKRHDNCKLSLHRTGNSGISESTTKAQLSCV